MRFENNQTGVLSVGAFDGTSRVRNCAFVSSGVPGAERPITALIIRAINRLEIENSTFEPGRGRAVILPQANLTWIAMGKCCTRWRAEVRRCRSPGASFRKALPCKLAQGMEGRRHLAGAARRHAMDLLNR